MFPRAPGELRLDGGTLSSDAGALLLGETDRAVALIDRFAACFTDHRDPRLIEHEVRTLVGQRVMGIASGYEDLNDHDLLRRDPAMAVVAGKLAAKRSDCAPVAGKSTLNRLELGGPEPSRRVKIAMASTHPCQNEFRRTNSPQKRQPAKVRPHTAPKPEILGSMRNPGWECAPQEFLRRANGVWP